MATRPRQLYAYFFCLATSFFVLVILRLHGSSMGFLSDDKSSLVLGVGRSIRSDEFLRSTPSLIRAIFHPNLESKSTLSYHGFDSPGLDAFELLRPERFLIETIFSGEYAFSAYWWLPGLLVMAGVPFFLSQLKVPLRISLPIGLVILFSPSVVWWSNGMALIIGRLSIGVAILVIATRLKGAKSALFSMIGVWIASGVAVDYQLWSIVASLFFIPILLFFFTQSASKLFVLFGSSIGLIPFLIFIYSKSDVFSIMSSTYYPGSRSFNGGLINAWNWSFAAPLQWSLLSPEGIISSNQSEISMGFFVFIVPALILYFRKKGIPSKFGLSELALGTFLILCSWSFVRFPSIPFNPLSLVSAERSLTLVTTLAPLVFGILYSALSRSTSRIERSWFSETPLKQPRDWGSIGFAISAGVLTFGSSLTMSLVVLNFSNRLALLASLVVGVLTYCVAHPRFSTYGAWGFAFLALLIGGAVNPLSQGTDPLTSNSLVELTSEIDSTGSWASDDIFIDSTLMANGRESISGQQLPGPNRDMWRTLDPSGLYERDWNSGASFVSIVWDPALEKVEISKPQQDVIRIRVNPCSQSLRDLNLRVVVSRSSLTSPCLDEATYFSTEYLGALVHVYLLPK